MSSYAKGKHAYGFCDRTGFRYPLRDLVKQIEDGRWNGLLVGRDVVDQDQPQLKLGDVNASDPQALRNPRPDNSLDEGRALFAFDPVGGGDTALGSRTVGLDMSGHVGRVSVEIGASDNVTIYPTGLAGTGSVNDVTVALQDAFAYPTGVAGQAAGGAVTASVNVTTYAITVSAPYGSGNKYYQDGTLPGSGGVNISEGQTYRFDQSDSSNSGHPLRFSTTSDGSHGGGSEYTTGVTTSGTPGSAGAYTQITVASGAPTLYTYCTNHSGMGYKVNTV